MIIFNKFAVIAGVHHHFGNGDRLAECKHNPFGNVARLGADHGTPSLMDTNVHADATVRQLIFGPAVFLIGGRYIRCLTEQKVAVVGRLQFFFLRKDHRGNFSVVQVDFNFADFNDCLPESFFNVININPDVARLGSVQTDGAPFVYINIGVRRDLFELFSILGYPDRKCLGEEESDRLTAGGVNIHTVECAHGMQVIENPACLFLRRREVCGAISVIEHIGVSAVTCRR